MLPVTTVWHVGQPSTARISAPTHAAHTGPCPQGRRLRRSAALKHMLHWPEMPLPLLLEPVGALPAGLEVGMLGVPGPLGALVPARALAQVSNSNLRACHSRLFHIPA